MFTWLSALPAWFQILFSLTLLVLTILSIFLLLKKGFDFKYRDAHFNVGPGGQRPKYNPHANCPHSKDVVIMLTKLQELYQAKMRISQLDTLRRQMSYVEERTAAIKSNLMKFYLEAMSEKGESNPVSTQSFQAYRLCLNEVHYNFVNAMRNLLREEQIHTYSDSDWSHFVTSKTAAFWQSIVDNINTYYFYEDMLRLSEVYDVNSGHKELVVYDIVLIFDRSRRIAVDSLLQIKQIDKQICFEIEKVLGEGAMT